MSPIDWKNILNGSVIVLLSPVCSSFCFFVYPVLILKGKLTKNENDSTVYAIFIVRPDRTT